jgi:hypothetical protein
MPRDRISGAGDAPTLEGTARRIAQVIAGLALGLLPLGFVLMSSGHSVFFRKTWPRFLSCSW